MQAMTQSKAGSSGNMLWTEQMESFVSCCANRACGSPAQCPTLRSGKSTILSAMLIACLPRQMNAALLLPAWDTAREQ